MDHGFARAAEPWESSDGAVYVLRELARLRDATLDARFDDEWLPTLAKLAALTHFRHASVLAETIWKQLPPLAQALGRERFTKFLPQMAPAFAVACKSTRLVHSTAAYALQDIAGMLQHGAAGDTTGESALLAALGGSALSNDEQEAVKSALKVA